MKSAAIVSAAMFCFSGSVLAVASEAVPSIKVESVRWSGDGCPTDEPDGVVNDTSAGKISALMRYLFVSTTQGEKDVRKSCNIDYKLLIPSGYEIFINQTESEQMLTLLDAGISAKVGTFVELTGHNFSMAGYSNNLLIGKDYDTRSMINQFSYTLNSSCETNVTMSVSKMLETQGSGPNTTAAGWLSIYRENIGFVLKKCA